MAGNKIKSESPGAAIATGYLSVGSAPGANQPFKQTGVVAVCFLQVNHAAAKLER